MIERFRLKLHLNRQNTIRLSNINKIITEYAQAGYKLTLRQLYYQLVSRDIVPNNKREYAKLSTLLVKGRMAGIVDWNAIEDRIRVPFLPYWVQDIEDAVDDTINYYRLDRQKGQKVYIELWVEKDALSGVLKRITSHYHINLMVNRGYSSCTAMYDASKRFYDKERQNINTYILYLGDHDPSGLDMLRDIEERLAEFGVCPEIRHIGLTSQQIKKYNPPPNPAKISDPRAKLYIGAYGDTSWEVDALNPKVLHSLVQANVENLIDVDLFNKKIKDEEKDKKTLKKLIK